MRRSGPFLLIVALFIVAVCAHPAFAIYKWVDDQGLLHISDYPPPSKTPEPGPEPGPVPGPARSVLPPSAPTATEAPAARPAQAASAPQTTQTKTAPAAVTKPSSTAVAAPTPVPVPATSPAIPSQARPQQTPMSKEGMMALAGGFMLIAILIGLAFYIYYALSMYLIAQKLNVAEAWMSWVPILNLWPFLSSAGKPCWWVLLLLVPVVNIIVIIYLWMCICENLGRNKWLGLLVLVPVVNLILPGVLAFSSKDQG